MSKKRSVLISFLKRLLKTQNRLPCQLARDLGVNHATVLRWLKGQDMPNIESCVKLSHYSNTPLLEILSITGHLIPANASNSTDSLPEFREYVTKKYPKAFNEDVIAMMEHLIASRRGDRSVKKGKRR